jgi:serine/threonine-protein kinase
MQPGGREGEGRDGRSRTQVTIPRTKAPETAQPGLRAGAIIGSYRVLGPLGEGGMGQVYLAEHIRLGRKVAIKRLRSEHARDPALVRRFFAEARAANRIVHENVIEICDFLETDEGDRCYVMELLRGQSLGDVLARESVLPLPRTLDVAMQVCSALAAVHAADIVHRDLKPENIFLIERGRRKDFVKLIDFGIAKLSQKLDGAASGETASSGAIMGTPEYMAPEQACGAPVDQRTDIYALGVILYELCSGRKPFSAATLADLLVKHQKATPPPPSHARPLPARVSQELDALILGCLAKDPAQRPATMSEVEARLRGVQLALRAAPEAPAAPRPRPLRRLLLAPALAGLLLLLAGVGGYAWVRLPGARAEVAPAPPAAPGTTATAAPGTTTTAAAPRRVALVFESNPRGAVVWDAAQDRIVGTTPCTLYVERSDEVATYDIRLYGRPAGRVEVPLARDARVALLLLPGGDPAPRDPPVQLGLTREAPPPAPRAAAHKAPRPRPSAPAAALPPPPPPASEQALAPSPVQPAHAEPKPSPGIMKRPKVGRGDVMDLDD